MRTLTLVVIGLTGWLSCATAPAQEPNVSAIVQQVKQATVYLKISWGPLDWTGSGFVIQQQNGTCYVVTNQHVIATPDLAQKTSQGRNLTAEEQEALQSAQQRLMHQEPEIQAVFHSGSSAELSYPARVLATDESNDLAVLLVERVVNAPQPLDISQPVQAVETMSVYLFGFPFGKLLAFNDRNPAITVSNGTVSSIREDRHGRPERIQIDGTLKPGNSGGPIVDARGRLVGVAASTVEGTNIGFAIPPERLHDLLQGTVTTWAATPRQYGVMRLEGAVADAFERVHSVRVHYSGRLLHPPPPSGCLLESPRHADLNQSEGSLLGEVSLHEAYQTATLYLQLEVIRRDGTRFWTPTQTYAPASQPVPAQAMQQAPMPAAPRQRISDDAEKLFQILDRNRDGRIAVSEYNQVSKDISGALLERSGRRWGDELTYNDFVCMFPAAEPAQFPPTPAHATEPGQARLVEIASISEPGWQVESLAFSPDSGLLAVGTRSGEVYLYRLSDQRRLTQVNVANELGRVTALLFCPDGTQLIAGGSSGRIQVWELSRSQELQPVCTLPGHGDAVTVLVCNRQNRWLLAGDAGGTVCAWKQEMQQPLMIWSGFQDPVASMYLTEDNRHILVTDGCELKQLALSTQEVASTLPLSRRPSELVDISVNGRWVVGANGYALSCWNLESRREQSRMETHDLPGVVRCTLDGRYVICSAPRELSIYDRQTGRLLPELSPRTNYPVRSLAVSGEGHIAAACGSPMQAKVLVYALQADER